jgi:hypothetical protein
MFSFVSFSCAVCVALVAGCGRDETPCLEWVDIGTSYRVEVLDSFDALTPDGEPRRVPPYASYGAEPSCGRFLGDDLEGRKLTFTAAELITSETGSCALVRAEAPIPGLVLEELRDTATVATTFRRAAKIETEAGCTGIYTIGIVRVLDSFIDSESEAVPSDHMVFREFLPALEDSECLEWPDLGYPCGDTWYVRIRGPSDTPISRDADEISASL